MKKLSNTEAEMKISVAYKISVYFDFFILVVVYPIWQVVVISDFVFFLLF